MNSRIAKVDHDGTMNNLYNLTWIAKAKESVPDHSWSPEVLKFISRGGEIYLETIKTWYQSYPNKSEHLKNLLESLDTKSHLGGVNELFWWELMKKFHWIAQPIEVGSEKRPDFHIMGPSEFFCEVATLNISERDEAALRCKNGVELNHEATIYRVLRKVTDEKKEQIDYGFKKGCPSTLVLFDYTTFSGLATNFSHIFKQKLLGTEDGFAELSKSLSAIVYIEKKIICTRFCVSVKRSAVFHNLYAEYPLHKTVFTMIPQYEKEGADSSIKLRNGWVCL